MHRRGGERFCPECRAEYRPGFWRCADCDVALVASLPPEPDLPSDLADEIEVFRSTRPFEAEMVAGALEDQEIPCRLRREDSGGLHVTSAEGALAPAQGSLVVVPHAALDEARALVAALPMSGPVPVDGPFDTERPSAWSGRKISAGALLVLFLVPMLYGAVAIVRLLLRW